MTAPATHVDGTPHSWGAVKRLSYAVILQALEDLGLHGTGRYGGTIEQARETEQQMLARALDAAEYIEGELFDYDCAIIGFNPENWRGRTAAARQSVRAALAAHVLPFGVVRAVHVRLVPVRIIVHRIHAVILAEGNGADLPASQGVMYG